MIIAILGLGEAGAHFANDLAEKGIQIRGYDPDVKRSLYLANSNAEAAENADII